MEKVNMAMQPYCEGLLSLAIADFIFLKEPIRGPSVQINGLSWRIKAIPKAHFGDKKASKKCLSFHVECCQYPFSGTWSCKASAELRLKSQKEGVEDFIRTVDQVYTAKENDWGYSCYATWDEITSESLGYIKNGVVVLEALIKAELPKNLTLDQLRKKAEDYMALADMQYGRGLIDKAIEVNETASNFCKDNRICCLDEALHQQKQKLIDAKLVERIKTIEEGPQDGENALDRNALKRAISALPKGTKYSKHPSFRCLGTTLQAVTMTELCEDESIRTTSSPYDSIYRRAKTGASSWNEGDSSALEQGENIGGSKLDGTCGSKKLMPELEKCFLGESADRRAVESRGETCPLRSDCGSQRSHPPFTVDHSCQTVECLSGTTGCQQYTESEKGEMTLLKCLEEREALMQEVANSTSHAKPSVKNCTGFFGSVSDLFNAVKERCGVDELNEALGELAVLAEGVGDARALKVSGAKEVGKNGARTKAEVLFSFLENPEVKQRLKEISGISRTPKEMRHFETIIYSALKKGTIIELADAERLIEHVNKVAIRAEKLKDEKEDLKKQLADVQEKISKSTEEHNSWVELLEAEKSSSKDMAKIIRRVNNERDELKKSAEQQMKKANDRRKLQEKVDSLKKNIRNVEQKFESELGKLRKDLLVSKELEKEAIEESRAEEAQLIATKNQLSESSLELQRLKNALIAQTMDCSNKVMLVTECARKAEVRLLQLKLEIGLDILKQAYEESERNISELELKREQLARGRYYEVVERSIAAWRGRQRLITKLIVSAKNDFAVQIDQIKGGKQLASLPAISVAKPPPAPESFTFCDTHMQIPSTLEYRSLFAVTESASCGAQEMGAIASSSASDKRMLEGVTALSDIPLPMLRMHSWKDWFNVGSSRGSADSSSSSLANIGCYKRPLTHSWIAIIAAQMFLQMAAELIMFKAPQHSTELGGKHPGNTWAYANGWSSGNDVRFDQQPADTNMGGVLGRYSEQGLMQQTSTSQQLEPWSVGSEHQSTVFPTGEDFADNRMRPPSRHSDEIIRHLKMHFPALSCENLMEYLNELMIRNGCTSLDGMTIRDVVTGVAHLIVEKHARNSV